MFYENMKQETTETDPPIVTVNPENVTVKEETDILLFCQYEANPSTLISAKCRAGATRLERSGTNPALLTAPRTGLVCHPRAVSSDNELEEGIRGGAPFQLPVVTVIFGLLKSFASNPIHNIPVFRTVLAGFVKTAPKTS
ncbi:hypothetical protein AAG570_001076 [Ranatra chinensis]|uniref:Uncharacterized protein n=1 Tax=Ranatra chinensis TaxID=642074 RepID=A0ABD0YAT9_9HEMI